MPSAMAGPVGLCEGQDLPPGGADTASASSSAHGHGDAAAAGGRAALGRCHQGLTFILEVPVLGVPAPCSKETRGARVAQPGTAPAPSQLWGTRWGGPSTPGTPPPRRAS